MTPTKSASPLRTAYMALAALGIVFGDIGTSPMYSVAECMRVDGISATPESVTGVISLIFWSLMLVVTIKYLLFITRADNDGNGGIFAILALLRTCNRLSKPMVALVTCIALLAAALLLADSMITPALSVMAAVDGLRVGFSNTDHLIQPASLAIIVGLFLMQRLGTGALGTLFGPVMLIWFLTIAALGLQKIVETPEILWALSPIPAFKLISHLTTGAFFSLMGSVMLAITGAEAIYADMGHFGRRPISVAWYGIALASLLLNYLGQGALLIQTPFISDGNYSPFFALTPEGWLVPMVVLATLASIIASQAVISGMFSLTSQAVHMHFLPRLRVEHTSTEEAGQIYVPQINFLLAIGTIGFVLAFGTPSNLASAYGFAVASTMLLTTIAFNFVVIYIWRWSWGSTLLFLIFAIPLDALFFSAALAKIPQGGYVPAIISALFCFMMIAWLLGNRALMGLAHRLDMPLPLFAEVIDNRNDLHFQHRPAIFFQHLPFPKDLEATPQSLLRQVQLTSIVYQPSIVVEFETLDVPYLGGSARIQWDEYGHGIHRVVARFGFAENPTMDAIEQFGKEQGWWKTPADLVYFSAREDLRKGVKSSLPPWLRTPYQVMHHYDENMAQSLRLPALQYVELGLTVDV